MQGGLEMPVTLRIELDSTSKNILLLERYRKLLNENYKEPISSNFDDCTKDILRDLYVSNASDEDDSKILYSIFEISQQKIQNGTYH